MHKHPISHGNGSNRGFGLLHLSCGTIDGLSLLNTAELVAQTMLPGRSKAARVVYSGSTPKTLIHPWQIRLHWSKIPTSGRFSSPSLYKSPYYLMKSLQAKVDRWKGVRLYVTLHIPQEKDAISHVFRLTINPNSSTKKPLY